MAITRVTQFIRNICKTVDHDWGTPLKTGTRIDGNWVSTRTCNRCCIVRVISSEPQEGSRHIGKIDLWIRQYYGRKRKTA